MRKKIQNRSSEFKANVAIEALKEQKTISALAQIYEIYPNQISIWKKEFLDNTSLVFEKNHKRPKEDEMVSKLFEAISQLKIESDWFKKGCYRIYP